jgi:hypothetical protein
MPMVNPRPTSETKGSQASKDSITDFPDLCNPLSPLARLRPCLLLQPYPAGSHDLRRRRLRQGSLLRSCSSAPSSTFQRWRASRCSEVAGAGVPCRLRVFLIYCNQKQAILISASGVRLGDLLRSSRNSDRVCFIFIAQKYLLSAFLFGCGFILCRKLSRASAGAVSRSAFLHVSRLSVLSVKVLSYAIRQGGRKPHRVATSAAGWAGAGL